MQNISEIHRQRDQFTHEIRKKNREEMFSKRRNTNNNAEMTMIGNQSFMQEEKVDRKILIVDLSRKQLIRMLIEKEYTIQMLPSLIKDIFSEDIDAKHRGVIGIRKIISVENEPPIQSVIDAKLIPICIEMSKQNLYPQLQLQATWILTNVCSGTTEQCQSVIQKGGIPIFVQLLIENRPGIVDQAIWAVGNLSGDCIKYRDMILNAGALDQLNKIANLATEKNLVRQVAWTISNLCRGSPLPKYEKIKSGIVCLCYIIKTGILDKENLIDCLWAISYGCQSQKSKIQRVVETGVVQKLTSYCDSPFLNVLTPNLRILGNISVGNQLQTEQLLKYGILDIFSKLIQHDKKVIRRQVCWIISNITAGTASQVEQFLSKADLIKKVISLFQQDAAEIKREICYIFSNMVNYGDPAKVYNLYTSMNIIEFYARILMESSDVKTTETCLDTLYTALSLGGKVKQHSDSPNVFVKQLLNIPGLPQTIEKLQYHDSKGIYNRIVKILTKYFDLEEELNI